MRIVAIVGPYPIPFKPYYDTQFARFLQDGHELRIFSTGRMPGPLNEKVSRFDLETLTQTYPETLRDAVGVLPTILRRFATGPIRSMRAWAVGWKGGWGPDSNWRARFAAACRAVVVAQAHPDLILIHGTTSGAQFHWIRRLFPDTPTALYYHGGEPPQVAPLDDALAKLAFEGVDAVFTNTRFSRDHAVGRGCPADRIHILPVGFDLEDFPPPAERTYRREGTLRLLSAGRMSEEKGFIHALQALRALVHDRGLGSIEYRLTGDGYYRPTLEAFVEEHDLQDHVRFLGTLTTQQLLDEMAAADVLLLPSLQVGNWVENQACAVQEAMLMKTLVITSRTGGVPESVAPPLRPLIHEEGDWKGLTESIALLMGSEGEELTRLGSLGREFVVENYDVIDLNRRLIETTLRSFESSGSGTA